MGDGIINKYTIIIQGDGSSSRAQIHKENADIAERSPLFANSKIIKIDPNDGGAVALKAAEDIASQVDDDDEVNFYLTGHGALNGDEPCLMMDGGNLCAGDFARAISKFKCETTIVSDQCYSGNFGRFLAKFPLVRFIGLSGKDMTDSCYDFARRIFNAPKEADDDHDGTVSWVEAFDWATEDSGNVEYSLSTYFAGDQLKETPFKPEVVKAVDVGISNKDDLDKYLKNSEAGQYTIVLFSATAWCGPCRAEEPKFMAAANGQYQFLLIDDPEVIDKYKIEGGVPQYKVYGKGLSPEGIVAGHLIDEVLPKIPEYVAGREPLILADHWLNNGNEKEKLAAIEIFGKLAKKDPQAAISRLFKMISDDSEPVRMNAALELARVAPETKELIQCVRGLLGSKQQNVRYSATYIADIMGQHAVELIPGLKRAFETSDYYTSISAAGVLLKLTKYVQTGIPVENIVSALAKAVNRNANAPALRLENAKIISEFAPGEMKRIIKSLISLIFTEEKYLAKMAVVLLGRAGPEGKSAIPSLVKLYNDPSSDAKFQKVIADAIGKISYPSTEELLR